MSYTLFLKEILQHQLSLLQLFSHIGIVLCFCLIKKLFSHIFANADEVSMYL
jgi:hypothetical protein